MTALDKQDLRALSVLCDSQLYQDRLEPDFSRRGIRETIIEGTDGTNTETWGDKFIVHRGKTGVCDLTFQKQGDRWILADIHFDY